MRYTINNKGEVFNIKGRKLKVWKSSGYFACHYGLIHRLLAIKYIENPENKLCVNHINGVKTDNRLENLEWCTHSENTQHSWDTGLHDRLKHPKSLKGLKKSNKHKLSMSISAKKRKPNNVKLSKKDKQEIKKLKGIKTQQEIAVIYKVTQATISRVYNEIKRN